MNQVEKQKELFENIIDYNKNNLGNLDIVSNSISNNQKGGGYFSRIFGSKKETIQSYDALGVYGNLEQARKKSPLNQADIQKLAGELGFDLIRDTTGKMVPVPRNIANQEDYKTFLDKWTNANYAYTASHDNRNVRFKSYDKMDTSGSDISLMLDTYVDEILSVTSTNCSSVRVEIKNNKDLQTKLDRFLEMNNILENTYSDLRTLCKYGDFAYIFEVPDKGDLNKDSSTNQTQGMSLLTGSTKISTPYEPDEIYTRFIHPRSYNLKGYDSQLYSLLPNSNDVNTIAREYLPWEFVFCSLPNRDTFPAGNPIIEKCRTPFEKQTVMEELLAICRESKRQKIFLKVPVDGSDLTSKTQKLNMLKSTMLNLLVGGGGSRNGRQSMRADDSLINYHFIPSDVEVTSFRNDIDVSSTEDVEYFRNQTLTATRMPKSLFLADETDNLHGSAIKQQSIKFSRTLFPISKAYIKFLENISFLACYYMGADISNLEISVIIDDPIEVNEQKLEKFDKAMDLLSKYIDLRTTMDETFKLTPDVLKDICNNLGLDPRVFGIENLLSVGKFEEKNSNMDLKPMFESIGREIFKNKFLKETISENSISSAKIGVRKHLKENKSASDLEFLQKNVLIKNPVDGSKIRMNAALYECLRMQV